MLPVHLGGIDFFLFCVFFPMELSSYCLELSGISNCFVCLSLLSVFVSL